MYRKLITCTTLALAAGVAAPAWAQAASDYPSKPIRLVIPFPPGGGTDILSRVVANKLTEATKWTIVPENKAGAGGTIGITEAVKAPATGYDMVMGQKDNLILGPYLYKNLPWNPVKDLTPVAHVAYTPVIIATSVNSPYKSIADVVAAAKANPTRVTYGSPGNGTSIHIAGHMFEKAAGIELTHVPYKGSAPAISDLLGNQIAVMFDNMPSAIQHVRSGKLRPIAVTTAKRSPELPDVPTIAEAGVPGYEATSWFGLWSVAGTPQPVLDKLHASLTKVLKDPAVSKKIADQGGEVVIETPAQFDAFIKSEAAKWGKVVKESGAEV
nr:tripartite tricarboxylate transporter substrate binding protein [Comamonas jiangduensis]